MPNPNYRPDQPEYYNSSNKLDTLNNLIGGIPATINKEEIANAFANEDNFRAYAISCLECVNGTNSCRKPHGGEDVFVLYIRRGHKTEKYDPGSYHIKMHFGVSYRRRAVTAMADANVYIARIKLGKQGSEHFVLPSCKLLAVAVAVGKMGKDSFYAQVFHGTNPCDLIRCRGYVLCRVAVESQA